jgi:hypothetical protein
LRIVAPEGAQERRYFMRRSWITILIILIALVSAAACSSQGATNTPTDAIGAYIHALVAKDTNQVITLSCAAWEEQARQELRSFDANTLELKDLQCQEAGQEANATLVTCTGSILANYGAEQMELDLSNQVYKVVQEAGEWRMCGYK